MTAAVAVAGCLAAVALLGELRRREFLLRDAVHELRGPLGAVSLGIDSIARAPDSARRVAALQRELARAALAVEDVAAAGRGRRAPARAGSMRLLEVVQGSTEAWAAAAERRGRKVSLDWPAGASQVIADPRRLAQAFGNLLANAVEHGGGEIVVRGRPAGEAMRVEVADSGSGSSAVTGAGRGRGLAIAGRALSEAGGRLEAVERDGGRVAIAELPLDRAA